MSTAFFQAVSGAEKMLVRIDPAERFEIIEENFKTSSVRRDYLIYSTNATTLAQEAPVHLIFTGKQIILNPKSGNLSKLASRSI